MTAFTAIVQSIAIYLFITNNKIVFACQNIELSSNELGTVQFNQLSVELSQQFGNGRPSYISAVRENPIYLYHTSTSDPSSGIGRWVVGRELGVKGKCSVTNTTTCCCCSSVCCISELVKVITVNLCSSLQY